MTQIARLHFWGVEKPRMIYHRFIWFWKNEYQINILANLDTLSIVTFSASSRMPILCVGGREYILSNEEAYKILNTIQELAGIKE